MDMDKYNTLDSHHVFSPGSCTSFFYYYLLSFREATGKQMNMTQPIQHTWIF